jgi:hypothetical protein
MLGHSQNHLAVAGGCRAAFFDWSFGGTTVREISGVWEIPRNFFTPQSAKS